MQVYLHIYNTYSTNTRLLPCRCMTLKWRHTDVYEKLSRRIEVILLHAETKKMCVKSCPTLKMKSTVFSKVYF